MTEGKPTMDAPTWEADHQRRHLEVRGLADEFPWGCDAIGAVADALLVARAEVARLTRALLATSGYAIDLQRLIESHCRGEIVDTARSPHLAGMLNAFIRIEQGENQVYDCGGCIKVKGGE